MQMKFLKNWKKKYCLRMFYSKTGILMCIRLINTFPIIRLCKSASLNTQFESVFPEGNSVFNCFQEIKGFCLLPFLLIDLEL